MSTEVPTSVELEASREAEAAKSDLQQALNQVNERVEETMARWHPSRVIRTYPLASACIACALGVALGSRSEEQSFLGLLSIGGAIGLAVNSELLRKK